MYALNIDIETKRILSATYPQYAPIDAVIVVTMPYGDIADYLYVDGEYVYSPLPDSKYAKTSSDYDDSDITV